MDRSTLAMVFAYVLTQLVGPMDDHIADSNIVKILLSQPTILAILNTKRR